MKNRLFLMSTGLFYSLLFSQLVSANTLSLTCILDEDRSYKEEAAVFVDYDKHTLNLFDTEFKCNTPIFQEEPLHCESPIRGYQGKFKTVLQNKGGVFQLDIRLLLLSDDDGLGGIEDTRTFTCLIDQ